MFKRVAIIGVGLIGGSLGAAIKKRKLAARVVGIVRREESAKEIVERGIVDQAFTTAKLAEGLRDADLIILAGPIKAIVKHLQEIPRYVKSDTLIIDVGSTKAKIQKTANLYFNKPGTAKFVGCHPMAGSEQSGVENAREDLFENAVCFLTDDDPRIRLFWIALKARPVTIKPDLHDAWIAKMSHLPHLISFTLLEMFVELPLQLKLAIHDRLNPSLRPLAHFARLSKSNPDLWTDILISNRNAVLSALAELEKNIKEFRRHLHKSNSVKLKRLILLARHSAKDLLSNENEANTKT